MYNEKNIVALIPARGGSKGLPQKNIRPLLGKPLLAWTVEQAQASSYIDRIIISTEDPQIAKTARDYGAETPFMRPGHLVTDTAKGMDVVLHALTWLEQNEDVSYDVLVLLQPTSPLRATEDINRAIEKLFLRRARAIVSVCEARNHPFLMSILSDDGCMRNFIREEIRKNRQDLPVYYQINGAVYVAHCSYLKKNSSFIGEETFAYIMPQERSIDIDNMLDFRLAEMIMTDTQRSDNDTEE